MSIPVSLPDLEAKVGEYGWAYLLTVRDDLRPHTVAVHPEWDHDVLTMSVGNTTVANAEARSLISLCYPPVVAGDYSLIVDGTATVDGNNVRFAPTGAVLHRPAERPDALGESPTGCDSDCKPI